MKKMSRYFLFGALILMLVTAACTAEDGTTPTFPVTLPVEETSTSPVDTTETAATDTSATAETPTALETATSDGLSTPSGTPVGSTTQTLGTPGIPVTGLDIVLVECQFCVDTMAHALLVLPDTATFEIVSPPASTTTSSTSVTATTPLCTTVEVNNGRQVVLCSGPEMTPLTLNICTDANTCTDFPVDLLACPLTQQPVLPNNTQQAPNTPSTGAGSPTVTPTSGVIISTPTP